MLGFQEKNGRKIFRFLYGLLYSFFIGEECFYFEHFLRLRRDDHRRRSLDVVLVQVALEIEVGQRLRIEIRRSLVIGRQQLAQLAVGLDLMLVLQVVLLHVVVHALRHLRAAHERALGLLEERAQLLRDDHGALEDGQHTGLRALGALLGLRAAAALARVLDLAVDTLVQALHLAEEGHHRLAEGVQARRHGLEVLVERRRGASRHHGGGHLLHGGGGNHHGRGHGGGGGRRLGLLGLGLGGRRRGDHHINYNGGGLLLGYTLGGGLHGGGGTHYTGSRGSLSGHFTRIVYFMSYRVSNFICRRSNSIYYSEYFTYCRFFFEVLPGLTINSDVTHKLIHNFINRGEG